MYTKYEVDGANSFGENVRKPRMYTDGRTHTKRGPRRKQSAPPVFHQAGHKYSAVIPNVLQNSRPMSEGMNP